MPVATKITVMTSGPTDAERALLAALSRNDASAVAKALDDHPDLKTMLDRPLQGLPFDGTPLLAAVTHQNREMIDVLLRAGAHIDAKSHWWAGGFGALDTANLALVPFLIERGARVNAHAAARQGRLDDLRMIVEADGPQVHARGGDGQTPLHVAASVAVAEYLLDRGADIDARDIDHESTPAQYMVRDRPEVARYLVARGCQTDILLAAALGDLPLVERHLTADPASIRTRVSDEFFPRRDPRSGGTIYTWTLGSHKSAHAVARDFGHDTVWRLLMSQSAPVMQLAEACAAGDELLVRDLLVQHPSETGTLPPDIQRLLPDAARGNETATVRLMLEAGWPPDARGDHGGTALHWAAFHGNAGMAQDLLRHGAPIDVRDVDHDGDPLGWAIHGSEHGWGCRTGDYPATIAALRDAGAGE